MTDAPPEQAVLGQWIATPDDGSDGCTQNGCVLTPYAAIVPGLTGHWALSALGSGAPIKGRFAAGAVPDDQDISAFVQLESILGDESITGANWVRWASRSPLAPGLDQALQPHPLERAIEREFEHLAAVCRNPRTHIRTETERVLVSRARRLDARAAEWLSAHTEDWEHRKIAGIQPRRILAEMREEQWDLYENRIAVRLVDNLVAFLRRRIYEVERVLQNVFAKMETFQSSIGGNHRRTDRICRLWGEAWDAKIGREAAEKTVSRLYVLLYRVLGLMDSVLYRSLPLRSGVSPSLRVTNLLSNDDQYRGIARLWREWVTLGAPKSLNQSELYNRHQSLVKGFEAWCFLLTVRAAEQLRLEPIPQDSKTTIRRGTTIRLANGYALQWQLDGVATLSHESAAVMRIVPIVHALESSARPKDLAEAITPLIRSASGATAWTVVLHPSVPSARPDLPIRTIGNPPEPGTQGAIDFISVSPFSLDSVEKLARAIRWAMLPRRLMAYPPRIPIPPTELATNLEPYLTRRNGKNCALKKDPGDRNLARIQTLLQQVRERVGSLTADQSDIEKALLSAQGNPVLRGELNRRKRELLKPIEESNAKLRSVKSFDAELATARQALVSLSECPVCGSASRLDDRGGESFEAVCVDAGCRAFWGLRVEADSGRRIPFLLVEANSLELPRSDDESCVWVDEVYGCDVLSIPVFRGSGVVTFRPPRTGAVERIKEIMPVMAEPSSSKRN